MSTATDLQCQTILKGLLELEKVLENPLADKALDLKDNATSAQQKDLLTRLRKSLVQYVERTGDLVYIALIGHFSSGKSSTINSLLDLWDSPDKRSVGLHPTDKVITLITHKKNANSLLRVVSHGSVPLRLEPIEHPLLEAMVLTDTPGTGDPQLVEEMARDFLPICDLVLFFFSAASPLDSTDIPLLSELHRRLPFIPLKFIITRADELRVDSQLPVSASNFDFGKAAAFVAEIMSRITLLIESSNYSNNDFLLIDNKSEFNIEALRNELSRLSDPKNTTSRIGMHSHKVRFFQTTAENLREFFSTFLDTKLAELNRVVATAEKNIQKFHEGVIITNNNLTKSWFDHYSAIQDLKSKARDRIKSPADLPNSMLDAAAISKFVSSIRSDNTRQIGWVIDQVSQHVMQTYFLQVKRELSRVENTIARANLDSLSPHDHGLAPMTINWTFGNTELIPVERLARNVDELRKELRSYVLGAFTDCRRGFEDIQRALQQRFVIDKCEQIIDTAQSSLIQDLDVYFQNVQVYRTGVFAMSTKASIGKLGIGEELDQYETDFTDEDKESIKLQARQRLFPTYDDIVAVATTQLSNIGEQVRTILNETTTVQIDSPASSLVRIEQAAATELSTLLTDLKNELDRETGEFIGSMQTNLAGVIGTILHEYNSESSAAKQARTRRYAILVGGMAISTAIGYYIYYRVKQPVGQSLFEILGWGLLVEIIGTALGFGIAWFKDNYPETERKIKARHLAILKEKIKQTIESAVKAHTYSVLQPQMLGKKLEKIYTALSTSPSDAWQAAIEDFYRNVKGWNLKYKNIRQKYLSIIESFTKDSGRYFEDAQKNLATLKSTAHEIKENAIEPSFELLARTSEHLRALKDEITSIRFT